MSPLVFSGISFFTVNTDKDYKLVILVALVAFQWHLIFDEMPLKKNSIYLCLYSLVALVAFIFYINKENKKNNGICVKKNDIYMYYLMF